MKILALDVGTARIGVAKADTSVRIAMPETTLKADGTEFDAIKRLSRKYNTKWFVIGLPRNSQGVETKQSAYVRKFAAELKKQIPSAKIRFQDESLTSVVAEDRLKTRKKKYAKGDIDAEAATIILQDFIESFSAPSIETLLSDEPNADLGDRSDDEDYDPKKTKRKNRNNDHNPKNSYNKKMKKSKFIIPIIILAILIAVPLLLTSWYNGALESVVSANDCPTPNADNDNCKPTKFTVKDGESNSVVAANLESAGLIRSALAFQINMKLNHSDENADNTFKSGEYDLYRTSSSEEITKQLIAGAASNVFSFTFYPGETTKTIKNRLVEENGYSVEAVNAAFAKTDYGFPMLKAISSTATSLGAEPLEGFFYGDTYEFYVGESVENIVKASLADMQTTLDKNDFEAKFAAHNLSLAQGLTLASIVQREAHRNDQAMVAGVFYNRLSTSMTLGSDVTAQYAADLVDPERKTYTDNTSIVTIDSLYNTRVYAGLPPGPICNPSLSALEAVANPTPSDFLYFLTGDDGVMYYSIDGAGHQKNVRDHCAKSCSTAL